MRASATGSMFSAPPFLLSQSLLSRQRPPAAAAAAFRSFGGALRNRSSDSSSPPRGKPPSASRRKAPFKDGTRVSSSSGGNSSTFAAGAESGHSGGGLQPINPHRLFDGRPRAEKRQPGNFRNGFMNLGIPFRFVKRLGFETPSAVQSRAIPVLLQKWSQEVNAYDRESNVVVIQSSNGSGKTLAYLLPMFARIDPNSRGTQGLIITPTDSLARQINIQANKVVEPAKAFWEKDEDMQSAHPAFWLQPAGSRLEDQAYPPLSVLGTYSYLPRALERHDLSHIKYVILDEADYILSRAGPALEELLARLGAADPMFVFVTATASQQVLSTAQRLSTLDKPAVYISNKAMRPVSEVRDSIVEQNTLYLDMAKTITHSTISFNAPPDSREDTLARIQLLKHLIGTLLGQPTYKPGATILVFYHDLKLFSQYGVEDILRRAWNCTVSTLHEHASRAEIGKAFRLTRHVAVGADVVLCNDVISRGIDLKGITHVINFRVPDNKSVYVHRAGRVGRLGGFSSSVTTVRLRGNTLHPQSGQVITLVNQQDPEELQLLKKHTDGLKMKLSPFKAAPVKQQQSKK